MKRALLLVIAVLLGGGSALAATGTGSVTAPAVVTTLAFDGSRVAYSSGFSAGDCNRVRVWNLTTRAVTRLGRTTHCEQTSTGNTIDTLSIAGKRVVWLYSVGGNFTDWSVFTASTSSIRPKLLRHAYLDTADPSPMIVGVGGSSKAGQLLPYAVDRNVVVLSDSGARRFAWTAPARVTALAAGAGQVAVASSGGIVTVLDSSGRVLRQETYPSDLSVVRITGSGLFAQYGRTVEFRGGGQGRTTVLPANVLVQDAAVDRIYYSTGGVVHSRSLTSGGDRLLGAGKLVQAEGTRVAIASGNRVTVRAA
jgi:hypothetical protein